MIGTNEAIAGEKYTRVRRISACRLGAATGASLPYATVAATTTASEKASGLVYFLAEMAWVPAVAWSEGADG
jgi:hypothetical protein